VPTPVDQDGTTREDERPDGDLRFGPYRLLGVIEEGGMGEVHLAEAVEAVGEVERGQRVALKRPLIRRSEPGGEVRERFRREIAIGKRIRHPALVPILDSGELDDGYGLTPYFAMQLVEGRSLKGVLARDSRLSEPLVRSIGRQVAEGLAALHAEDVVHRDVKPANVLITPDHRVRLADLGIACILDSGEGLTESGTAIGSWAYTAPEQLLSSKHVSPAADLYSLGVLLYEALTGDCPFGGQGYARALREHETLVPMRVGRVRPTVSLFLEEIVTTLLQKAPSLRFGSAAELALILEAGESCDWWQARVGDVDRSGRRRVAKRLGVRVRPDELFVGRDETLRRLLDLEKQAREGIGTTVLIEGEAGSGKTRLLAEFVDRSEDRPSAVLHGTHRGGAGVRGLEGALDALLHHFGAKRLDAELARLLPDSPRQVQLLAGHLRGEALAEADDASPFAAVHAAALGVFRALAQEQPLVLPLLLVLTRRPDGGSVDPLAEALSRREVESLALQRLDLPDVERLLLSILGTRREAADNALSVFRRTTGNPFFVIAVARGIRVGDTSHRSESTGHSVPDSLRGMLLARIRNLESHDRRLIQLAAVLGSRFDPVGLSATLGEPVLRVLEALAELERKGGLLHAAGSEFEFEHDLLREAIEEDLNEALRGEYHGLIARAHLDSLPLGARAPGRVSGESALVLAHHLLYSRSPSEGLDHAPAALDQLFRTARNDELLCLADRALATARGDQCCLRARILLRQADCLELLGRHQAHHDCARSALQLAEDCNEPSLELRALGHLSHALQAKGETEAARQFAERRIVLARAAGEALPLARAFGSAGRLARLRGESERAQELIGSFLTLAEEAGDQAELAKALILQGQLRMGNQRYADARSDFREALRLARTVIHPRTEASALGNLSLAHVLSGDFRRAEPLLVEHVRLSKDLGFRQGRLVSTTNLAQTLLRLGRYAEVEDLVAEIGELDQSEAGVFRLLASLLRALADICTGRLERANAELEIVRQGFAGASSQMRVYLCDFETHLALAEARFDDASRWIHEGGREADAVHDGRSRAAFHVTASDLAWARG